MISTYYLATYNLVSAGLWLAIFVQNIADIAGILFPQLNWANSSVYHTHSYTSFPHKLLVYTQTFNAVVEISNTVVGITKSSVWMTCLQFFARCSITIGVCYLIPDSPGNFNKVAFPAMTLAWSTVELIRYPYYTLKIVGIGSPYFLDWLRYSAFIVLYPLGLLTEPAVIYDSLPYTISRFQYYFFLIGFLLYIPGFYFLYTYMWKQRRKVLGAEHTKTSKKD